MKIGNWYSVQVCSSCKKRLTQRQMMYSHSVCPYCGVSDGSTICDTKEVILRETKHQPFWWFWEKVSTFEGRDDFSKEWLKNNK